MPKNTNSKHALVIRLSSLGDIVLCSAFVKALAKNPDIKSISFVTSDAFKNILHSFPNELNIISAPKLKLLDSFKWGWRFSKDLPQENHIVFDLQSNLRSRAFVLGLTMGFLLFKPRLKIEIFRTARHTRLRTLSVWLKKDLLKKRFVYQDHQGILGISQLETPELKWQSKEKKGILLAPDSQHWKKRIPESLCLEILNEILPRTNETVTVVGAKGILSEAFFKYAEEHYPGRVLNKLGTLAIHELADVAASHRLCICGNSAWLHLSEAVQTPVLSFAGPIIQGFGFSPWKNESLELSKNLPCRPCTRHGGGNCSLPKEKQLACILGIDWRPQLKEILGRVL